MRNTKKSKHEVVNLEKYVGDPDNVICRSSWEKKVCRNLDGNTNVRRWGSEIAVVPYVSAVDGQWHRYFVDFYVELMDDRKFLVEVKPSGETQEPKLPKSGRMTKSYLMAQETWARNLSKWAAAKEYAEKRGMKFVIWTERELAALLKK